MSGYLTFVAACETDHVLSTPSRRFPDAPAFIGRSLREAFQLLMEELDRGIAQKHPDSSPGSNRVMAFIDRDGTSMAELARRCSMTRQSILEHVQRLQALGYVTRQPHPVDRRVQLVTLTEHGEQAIADGFMVVQAAHQRWTTAIGGEHMAQLIDLLDELIVAVRAERQVLLQHEPTTAGLASDEGG